MLAFTNQRKIIIQALEAHFYLIRYIIVVSLVASLRSLPKIDEKRQEKLGDVLVLCWRDIGKSAIPEADSSAAIQVYRPEFE